MSTSFALPLHLQYSSSKTNVSNQYQLEHNAQAAGNITVYGNVVNSELTPNASSDFHANFGGNNSQHSADGCSNSAMKKTVSEDDLWIFYMFFIIHIILNKPHIIFCYIKDQISSLFYFEYYE